MKLYFIRHGLSENNLRWYETKSAEGREPDPELTDVGRQQAQHLARFLKGAGPPAPWSDPAYDTQNVLGFHLTHLYTSLMVRAVATATIVAREVNLSPVAWPEVHEVGGIHQRDPESGLRVGLPGNNRHFFEAHYPELQLPPSLGEGGWWNSRPYEQPEQAAERARRLLGCLMERHGDTIDRVALVSHGGLYRHLMRAILGLPPDAPVSFSLNNGALTRIDFWDWGNQVVYANRVDYLPSELVS